ncbi:MAG TPA: ATP-binding protein [Isosphaeraceae bacterium]|nr:ATP-binding protein [Isosphaeraceae bacterium]
MRWLTRQTIPAGSWPAPARRLVWYAAALAGVALTTLVIRLMQSRVDPSRLQMSYLLLVLAVAIIGGRGAAAIASIAAFLAFDWYFVRPIGNLVVGDPAEWFALGLFLAVGIATGTLAAGLKESAAEARRRGGETSVLLELSTDLLAGPDLTLVLRQVVQRLTATLDLCAAAVRLVAPDENLALVASHTQSDAFEQIVVNDTTAESASAALSAQPIAVVLPQDSIASAAARAIHVPLMLNGRVLGAISAYLDALHPGLAKQELRLLQAFAAQTALAVGRVRLIEEEERARVAEESDRMKSVFLDSISHDLRTPITTIKTAAALLLERPEDCIAEDATQDIDREADRLNQLVGNLLEMSRIEAGNASLRLAVEDLAETVGAAVEQVSVLARGRELKLSSTAQLAPVRIDPPQMERVVVNLLENAVKFSPSGTGIEVELYATNDSTVMRVLNAGPPIPVGEQDRIFDKFYRVRRRGTDGGGTGLGLAICRSIVEAHGGRIWTVNEPGGVAFYVSLPSCSPDDAAAGNAAAVHR